MARAALREMVFGLAVTGLLMGCVEGGGESGEGGNTGFLAAPAKKTGSQDVEAPEVFQVAETALWDGRPSLGGIWVASPEVTNPERVLMLNPANGKSVTGALFRRERDNPGPRLQLSSDAADALGILAGQPTEIKVTALRKEEVVEETPAEATTDEAAAAPAPENTADDGEAAAIASAALEAVDAQKPQAATAEAEGDPAVAAVAGTAAVAAEAIDGVVAEEPPKRKTWKERRAEAKAAREAKKKAAAEAAAAAAAAEAGAEALEGEIPASPDTVAVTPIESAPLDARKVEVTEDAEEASVRSEPQPIPETNSKQTEEAPNVETAAPAEAENPAPESGASRPIQVASFSKEDNAKRAAEALAKIGVTATPQKSEKNGKAVWGVVVMGDKAMLQKIKDAGFADAYFLK